MFKPAMRLRTHEKPYNTKADTGQMQNFSADDERMLQ